MHDIELEPRQEALLESKKTDAVLRQVSADLKEYLGKSQEKNTRLNFISKKIGIHKKTIKRIIDQENKPNYMTVFKIYRFLFNENDDAQVLAKAPTLVRKYLEKAVPEGVHQNTSYRVDIENELTKDSVALEIYVLAGTGEIDREDLIKRYGEYGLKSLKKLLHLQVLNEHAPHKYSLGRARFNMSAETIIHLSHHMIESYSKPGHEVNQNHICFYAEGLSSAAYQEWLKIDHEAYLKKLEVCKKPDALGSIRAFTTSVVETLDKGNIYE